MVRRVGGKDLDIRAVCFEARGILGSAASALESTLGADPDGPDRRRAVATFHGSGQGVLKGYGRREGNIKATSQTGLTLLEVL